MDKTSYISPSMASLNVTIIRDANPTIVLALDVGLPNYLPHFELKIPLIDDGEGTRTAAVVREALGVLLDEVMMFMQSMEYSREVQVLLYSSALQCFEDMTAESEADAIMPNYTRDNIVRVYEGTFRMPDSFVEETQKRVVTAATKVQRVAPIRRIELTKLPPSKTTTKDIENIIRTYRSRSLQQQPHRLYIMVYDQTGHPAGILPAQAWKNLLLKKGTIGDREGSLVLPLVGQGNKLYPKGHPVRITPKNGNPHRFEIHDRVTGVPITEAHVKELAQIAH